MIRRRRRRRSWCRHGAAPAELDRVEGQRLAVELDDVAQVQIAMAFAHAALAAQVQAQWRDALRISRSLQSCRSAPLPSPSAAKLARAQASTPAGRRKAAGEAGSAAWNTLPRQASTSVWCCAYESIEQQLLSKWRMRSSQSIAPLAPSGSLTRCASVPLHRPHVESCARCAGSGAARSRRGLRGQGRNRGRAAIGLRAACRRIRRPAAARRCASDAPCPPQRSQRRLQRCHQRAGAGPASGRGWVDRNRLLPNRRRQRFPRAVCRRGRGGPPIAVRSSTKVEYHRDHQQRLRKVAGDQPADHGWPWARGSSGPRPGRARSASCRRPSRWWSSRSAARACGRRRAAPPVVQAVPPRRARWRSRSAGSNLVAMPTARSGR